MKVTLPGIDVEGLLLCERAEITPEGRMNITAAIPTGLVITDDTAAVAFSLVFRVVTHQPASHALQMRFVTGTANAAPLQFTLAANTPGRAELHATPPLPMNVRAGYPVRIQIARQDTDQWSDLLVSETVERRVG